MKQSGMRKFAAILLVVSLFVVFGGCVSADTTVNIKRNGSATITVDVIMDSATVTEKYGMPTNFYDAIEADARFSKLVGWEGEYIKETIDGVEYLGIRKTKTVEKDDISGALNEIYGQMATVTYSDKNVFGTRTISLDANSLHYPFTQEEQAAVLSGDSKSVLTITSPVAISETNGEKTGDKEISVDMMEVINGKEPRLSVYIKFFDYMFFVPIAAVAIVVIAAAIFVLVRVRRIKKQNEGLTSIDLNKKPAKPAFSGFGGLGKGGADKGEAKPKSGMSFAKKAPKYTSSKEEPVAAEAPAIEPSAPAAPAAPAANAAPARKPSPFGRKPAPTPAAPVPETSVSEAPAPAATPAAPAPAPVPTPSMGSIFTTASTVGVAPKESSFGSSESPDTGSARLKSVAQEEKQTTSYGSAKMSHGSTETEEIPHAAYGSAKMSRGGKPEISASGAGSLFTPRSTAPNLSYGLSDDFGLEDKRGSIPAKEEHKDSSLSGMFTPRSTAPNLEYGFSDEAILEDAREKKAKQGGDSEESHSGLFTPRSTAPNLGYGFSEDIGLEEDEKERKSPFVKEETQPIHSDLFTPRSTAPNYNYGISDDLGLGEEKPKGSPFVKPESTEHSGLFTPRSTAPNLNYGHEKEDDLGYGFGRKQSADTQSSAAQAPAEPAYSEPAYSEPAYSEPAYSEPAYSESAYSESAYTEGYSEDAYATSYDESSYGYSEGGDGYGTSSYEESGYGDGSYTDGGYSDGYSESSYSEPAPAVSPVEYGSSAGSIYQTTGYDASPYQSANSGASEKSTAISQAYGGSKLGSGAYLGGATTGATIGRSVGNIGGYVDETMVNTSSYGSDPYGGTPLPKLGESGVGGGGIFTIDSSGGFGSSGVSTIGGGTFGSGSASGGYSSAVSAGSYSAIPTGESWSGGTESPSFGKRFNTGGSGKFDFGMAAGNSGRKCPFCKEPIRDDDVICIACGAELSRPYGSY